MAKIFNYKKLLNHLQTGFSLLLLIAAAIVFIVVMGTKYKLHPFLVLLLAALLTGWCSGMPINEIANTANEGFGNMMKKIGLVVILGTLIGTVLEKSGAIVQLANALLRCFGEKRPIAAITIIGAVIGIPIFCDSGFVILNGLAKPLAQKTNKSYAAIVCGLASGLYITHTLLPPHPGSIAGAANLGLKEHLGIVIGIGFLLAIPVIMVAWWFSSRMVKHVQVPEPNKIEGCVPDSLPALWKCVLPVAVPVLLIALSSFSVFVPLAPLAKMSIDFVGHPVIALLAGFGLSLLSVQKSSFRQLQHWMKEAVVHAGSILVIVGAGGVFGEILKKTALADFINSFAIGNEGSRYIFLLVAWCMGVLLKTAQGSTTSAIIVVTSILAPLTAAAGFDTAVELSLLLAAVSGGTMMVSHTNDAYFWVISEFSGLNMAQTYRSFSLATVAMSVTVLLATLLLAVFFF
jgi:gluconate:H+ symporter, GntP family